MEEDLAEAVEEEGPGECALGMCKGVQHFESLVVLSLICGGVHSHHP